MSALGFCRECGNMIQKHYRYCPFCGDRQEPPRDHPTVYTAPVVRRADPVTRARVYLERLLNLQRRLDELDRDLVEFTSQTAPADSDLLTRKITP
jgi:hypothetical protein